MTGLRTLTDTQIERLTLRATRSAALAALDAEHGPEITDALAEQHPAEPLDDNAE